MSEAVNPSDKEEKKDESSAPYPEPTFLFHITGLATQVMMALGEMENPLTREKKTDLDQAKFLLDTLEMLRKKTEGNLDDREDKYTRQILMDLRMKFVEKAGKR